MEKELLESLDEVMKKEQLQDGTGISSHVRLHCESETTQRGGGGGEEEEEGNKENLQQGEGETMDCDGGEGAEHDDINKVEREDSGNKETNFNVVVQKSPLDGAIGGNADDAASKTLSAPVTEVLKLAGNVSDGYVDIMKLSAEPKNSIACGVGGMVDILAENVNLEGDDSVPQNEILSENEGIIKSSTCSTHVVNVSVSLLQGSVFSTRIDGVGDEGIDAPLMGSSVSSTDGFGSTILDYNPTRSNNEVNRPALDGSGRIIDGVILLRNNSIKNIDDDVNVPVCDESGVINDGGFLVLEHRSIAHNHCKEDIGISERPQELISTSAGNDVNVSVSINKMLINDSALVVSPPAHDHDIQDSNTSENVGIEDIGSKVEHHEPIQDDGKGCLESKFIQQSPVSSEIENDKIVLRGEDADGNQVEPRNVPSAIKKQEMKGADKGDEAESMDFGMLSAGQELNTSNKRTSCRADLLEQGKSEDVLSNKEVHHENAEDIMRTENRSGEISEERERKEIEFKGNENDTNSKSVQKRKDGGMVHKQQEPCKRVRRWGSDNNNQLGITKPLTMDTVNEITSPGIMECPPIVPSKPSTKILAMPETNKCSSNEASKPSQKMVATVYMNTAIPKQPEPEVNSMKQTVPAPLRPPTVSLKIERFVRPFTLNAAKEMLGEFGRIIDFWMDQIKTHCYITYSSVDEAAAARNELYNKRWPPSFGNMLVAEFVDPSEVKAKSEGIIQGKAMINLQATVQPPNKSSSPVSLSQQPDALPPPPPPLPHLLKEKSILVQAQKKPEPKVLTLDDFFCKTIAKPHIYYLPLTDEQVSRKLSVKGKERELTRKPSARA